MSQARSTVMNVNEPAGSQTSWTIFAGMKLNAPGPSLARFPSHAMVSVARMIRSEEHTSELQSRPHLVCRLLLEKKKQTRSENWHHTTPQHDAGLHLP